MFGKLVHLGPRSVKFEGQRHGSKFKVQGYGRKILLKWSMRPRVRAQYRT